MNYRWWTFGAGGWGVKLGPVSIGWACGCYGIYLLGRWGVEWSKRFGWLVLR